MKQIRAELGYRGLFAGPAGARPPLPLAGLCRLTVVTSSPGFMPRVIKVAPACAIMISTYEFGKSFFRRRNLGGE